MIVTNANIMPAPAGYPYSGKVSIEFVLIAELTDHMLSSDDMDSAFAMITISLSNLQGSSSITPTGEGGDLFTWTYIESVNSYIGKSKDVLMQADNMYKFTFTDLPII